MMIGLHTVIPEFTCIALKVNGLNVVVKIPSKIILR
jgi:hypothetical protein